jgi:sigma54-dependent transcription regulator
MPSLVDQLLPGDSDLLQVVREEILQAAQLSVPVLLLGETGTGKEVAARLIHELSGRSEHPFVAVNLAALPRSLAAAQLIGHAKGAFTGADRDRQGFFEIANSGTLFLDEIAEATQETQIILLRMLEEKSVRRLGESTARRIDARVIAATSTDITALVSAGSFRAGLFYRLSSVQIRIPALRERRADIPALASLALTRLSSRFGKEHTLTADAVEALLQYSFPGNFRELESILARAALRTTKVAIDVSALDLPRTPTRRRKRSTAASRLEAETRQLQLLQREVDLLRATRIAAQPIWQGRGFVVQHDYCFVLMPFAEERDLQVIYSDHLRPVVERCGLRCERADDIYDISGVMQSVWEGINKARVVIADLTGRNANVFYELGIAHTLGKPVIMLTQAIDFIPFDLRHLRCIVYSYTPPGAAQLERALERTIRTVLSAALDLRPL